MIPAILCHQDTDSSECGYDRFDESTQSIYRQADFNPAECRKTCDSKGVTFYEQTPSEFAGDVRKIQEAGADMIGDCCDTTPEFIKAIADT